MKRGDSWKSGTEYGDKGMVPKDLEKKMKELFVNKTNYLIGLEKKKISNLDKDEKQE